MNLFARAAANAALTPGERAFLKFIKFALFSAIFTAIVAVLPLLSGATAPDWQRVAVVGAASAVMTLLASVDKYATAQGDPVIGAVAGAAASGVSNATGVPQPKQVIDPPAWLAESPSAAIPAPPPPPTSSTVTVSNL